MNKIEEIRTKILNGIATQEDYVLLDRLIQQIVEEEAGQNTARTGKVEEQLNKLMVRVQTAAPDQPSIHISRRYFWLAAASVILVAFIGWRLYETSTGVRTPLDQFATREPIVIKGQTYETLPDGSKVTLNVGSSVTYDDEFGDKDRIVTLTGEGYFDIAHNADKPFKVRTGSVTTTVLGTAFNIKANFQEGKVIVTVTRGRVSVSNSNGELASLTPNEQLIVNTSTNTATSSQVVAEQEIAWKRNYLIFDNLTVEAAVSQVAERFNTRMQFADDSPAKECVINVAFLHGEDMETMLRVLTGIVRARYKFENNTIIIEGGKACDLQNQ